MPTKVVNGQRVEMTPEEVAQRRKEEAAHAEALRQQQEAENAKQQAKLTALPKLRKLGLTDEEISAITK